MMSPWLFNVNMDEVKEAQENRSKISEDGFNVDYLATDRELTR